MTGVRIAGPRDLLDQTLRVLQDLEMVHLVRPDVAAPSWQGSLAAGAPVDREARHLRRIVDDAEAALSLLGATASVPAPSGTRVPVLTQAARLARHTRLRAGRLARAMSALEDERVLLLRYRGFFVAFEPLLGHEVGWPDGQAFYVVLRAGAEGAVEKMTHRLEAAVAGELEVLARPLASGETAVLVLASAEAAPKVGQLIAASRVQELPAPEGLGETNLLRAMPALEARLAAIPKELASLEKKRTHLREAHHAELAWLVAYLHDQLLVLDAREQAHAGRHLFVLEGWVPRAELPRLTTRAARDLGAEVLVEAVGSESWARTDAPVALANSPLVRPFEVITRTLPLPRYGTIDPTALVAVFFPMFFGLMVGDVGYGALLVLLAVVLRLRSKPRSTLRSIAAVGGACAAFAIIFGVVFGELFGDLGHRLFGMVPHGFNREGAIVPFLALAVALGVVHISLGLVLAVVNAWRQGHRREAVGRGVAALMVLLTVSALLAALEVLPSVLFAPFAIGVLVAFPILVALAGIVAVIELVSAFGHILSYARIMAIGTASLMLAVVANKMVGAMGSALVGVLFALLFHIVNFAIGIFSPTIHALRLHYVEFFGKFFSPGGTAYRPLTHWHPSKQGS